MVLNISFVVGQQVCPSVNYCRFRERMFYIKCEMISLDKCVFIGTRPWY